MNQLQLALIRLSGCRIDSFYGDVIHNIFDSVAVAVQERQVAGEDRAEGSKDSDQGRFHIAGPLWIEEIGESIGVFVPITWQINCSSGPRHIFFVL